MASRGRLLVLGQLYRGAMRAADIRWLRFCNTNHGAILMSTGTTKGPLTVDHQA